MTYSQKIQYAKGKSDTISKLDGTFRAPVPAGAVTATELQQSIFNAPPSATTAPPTSTPTLKPPEAAVNGAVSEDGAKSPQGIKRRREDESDEEDAPMDEDDEGDAPMEDSSEEE